MFLCHFCFQVLISNPPYQTHSLRVQVHLRQILSSLCLSRETKSIQSKVSAVEENWPDHGLADPSRRESR